MLNPYVGAAAIGIALAILPAHVRWIPHAGIILLVVISINGEGMLSSKVMRIAALIAAWVIGDLWMSSVTPQGSAWPVLINILVTAWALRPPALPSSASLEINAPDRDRFDALRSQLRTPRKDPGDPLVAKLVAAWPDRSQSSQSQPKTQPVEPVREEPKLSRPSVAPSFVTVEQRPGVWRQRPPEPAPPEPIDKAQLTMEGQTRSSVDIQPASPGIGIGRLAFRPLAWLVDFVGRLVWTVIGPLIRFVHDTFFREAPDAMKAERPWYEDRRVAVILVAGVALCLPVQLYLMGSWRISDLWNVASNRSAEPDIALVSPAPLESIPGERPPASMPASASPPASRSFVTPEPTMTHSKSSTVTPLSALPSPGAAGAADWPPIPAIKPSLPPLPANQLPGNQGAGTQGAMGHVGTVDPGPPIPPPDPTVMRVRHTPALEGRATMDLTLFAWPAFDGTKKTPVKSGESLQVLESLSNGWLLVRLPSKDEGYFPATGFSRESAPR